MWNNLSKGTPNVIVRGDFNLPNIGWEEVCSTNPQTVSKHNKLIEIISKFGLQNIVNEIRQPESNNILDPAFISNLRTVPGMSDYEAVSFNVNLKSIYKTKPPHKVFKNKTYEKN